MPEPKRGQREGQGFVHCQDDRSVAVGDRCIITVLLSSRSSVALSLWAGEDKRLDDVSVCVCVCGGGGWGWGWGGGGGSSSNVLISLLTFTCDAFAMVRIR